MKKSFTPIILFVLMFLFPCSTSLFAGEEVMTSYAYNNTSWPGIASSAVVKVKDRVIATAEALYIDKTHGTPYCMKIRETHFDYKNGSKIYEGYVLIRFGFGGVISETAINGKRKYQFFTSWPSS